MRSMTYTIREAVSSLLDITAHFHGNRRELINMVFPQMNSYLPLITQGLKLDY